MSRLIGSDEQAVADVFQETMMAVAKSGRNLAPDTRLWAWLSRISHNQAALHWRKQYRERSVPVDETSEAGDPSDPLEMLIRWDTVQHVRSLLAEMNSDYVAVLCAKYLDGQSIQQMVESLDGTAESIKSRLARARRDFRSRYEQMTKDTVGPRRPNASTSQQKDRP